MVRDEAYFETLVRLAWVDGFECGCERAGFEIPEGVEIELLWENSSAARFLADVYDEHVGDDLQTL